MLIISGVAPFTTTDKSKLFNKQFLYTETKLHQYTVQIMVLH